jgi:hypothetical protein
VVVLVFSGVIVATPPAMVTSSASKLNTSSENTTSTRMGCSLVISGANSPTEATAVSVVVGSVMS